LMPGTMFWALSTSTKGTPSLVDWYSVSSNMIAPLMYCVGGCVVSKVRGTHTHTHAHTGTRTRTHTETHTHTHIHTHAHTHTKTHTHIHTETHTHTDTQTDLAEAGGRVKELAPLPAVLLGVVHADGGQALARGGVALVAGVRVCVCVCVCVCVDMDVHM
jgi:hypothetical protein